MLVSERVGQFFFHTEDGRDRLEYTEYGAGDSWVVLVHGQLMTRRMHEPLARALAGSGLHVVALDLLGHGRSDRPADPLAYSVQAFGEQVVALLDHLGAPEAVVGGTSLGANVALEGAVAAPDRVRGLLLEMPVLDNALEASIVAASPLLLASRLLPVSVDGARLLSGVVPRSLLPFWAGVALDVLDQRPGATAALLHGLLFGRIAPMSRLTGPLAASTTSGARTRAAFCTVIWFSMAAGSKISHSKSRPARESSWCWAVPAKPITPPRLLMCWRTASTFRPSGANSSPSCSRMAITRTPSSSDRNFAAW